MLLQYYLEKLDCYSIPKFLEKYLKCPSLVRLKKVGYFCGMDYASKDVYDFSEKITRYDHSLSVALLTYRLTLDRKATIAALFHDIATPCFSHVIDYMNDDYANQESTEEYTEQIISSDVYLIQCLDEDFFPIADLVSFKNYSVVDNSRPKLCADRLDGVILTGIAWTKNITKSDIDDIIDNIVLYKNEDGEDEIGFTAYGVAKKVLEVSESIDLYCHSNYDNYMMLLLANITKKAIELGIISYEDLYKLDEETLINRLKNANNAILSHMLKRFESVKLDEIPKTELPNVKVRDLNPLVNAQRIRQ